MKIEKVLKAAILILFLVLLLIPLAKLHGEMVNLLANISANLTKMIFHALGLYNPQ